MTQVPAAAAAGISQAGLSRIERGGLLPSPETRGSRRATSDSR